MGLRGSSVEVAPITWGDKRSAKFDDGSWGCILVVSEYGKAGSWHICPVVVAPSRSLSVPENSLYILKGQEMWGGCTFTDSRYSGMLHLDHCRCLCGV